MHILISAVSSARYPSGICRHAANLAFSLTMFREIQRVTLVVGPWQAPYFRTSFHLNETAVDLRMADVANNAYERNSWYHRALPKTAAACGADVVHLSFPAPIIRRRFSCPVICSLHDLYPYDAPANFGSARVFFNRLFLRQCLAQSDAVVCSSEFTRQRLQLFAPATVQRKAACIHQMVGLDPLSSRSPHIKQLRFRSFLLTVAQHRSNKNLALLLSAFASVRRRSCANRALQLVIVGAEGPETNNLYSLVEQYSLKDHVLFRSALPDAELCWLYKNSALVILPSKIEGFCLPLAEALRCGGNVLCSDIPVLREVGASDCRYFSLDTRDPAGELAESITAALQTHPPRSDANHRFTPQEITPRYIDLYRNLLAAAKQSDVPDATDEDVFRSEHCAV